MTFDAVRRNIGTGASAIADCGGCRCFWHEDLPDDEISRALEGQTTLEEVVRIKMQQEVE